MSKKPTIADYKLRAETAEAKLEAVLKALKNELAQSAEGVTEAKLKFEKVRDTLDYAERAVRNATPQS